MFPRRHRQTVQSPWSSQPRLPRIGVRAARVACCILALSAFLGVPTASLFALPPVVTQDPSGDAVPRASNGDAPGDIDPAAHRLPDIHAYTIGFWQPTSPHLDLFSGSFANDGIFFRLDLVFDGLVNPPGTSGCCGLLFDPFKYGAHPIFGRVEIDIDGSFTTGGEPDQPQLTYLGNVARFGGLPVDPGLNRRAALDQSAFDNDIQTPPLVDRSGEEFHLEFAGRHVTGIDKSDDTDLTFGPGEEWIVQGRLFHRAHGYRAFSYACCQAPNGSYEPEVRVRFAHDVLADETMISLVYPLTNEADAMARNESTELLDFDPANQNSVLEALNELVFAMKHPDPAWSNDPQIVLVQHWDQFDLYPNNNDARQFLNPLGWKLTVLAGSMPTTFDGGVHFIWTDVAPDALAHDFDGDGAVTWRDLVLFETFLSASDGAVGTDLDGTTNCSLEIPNFGPNFSLFDVNYDGIVDDQDRPVLVSGSLIPGDFDRDGDVDHRDFSRWQTCLGGSDAPAYPATCGQADLNLDGEVNRDDLAIFEACATGPGIPADVMCVAAVVDVCAGN